MKEVSWKYFKKKYIKIPYLISKASIHDAINQDGVEHAGYLAFLSILSLFPFLILLFSITTYLGNSEVGARLFFGILTLIPPNMADALGPRISEIVNGPPQSLLTVAIIGIVWTASSGVEGLRTILNRAYRVHSPPPYIWRRLLSIIQFLIITLLMTVTMVLLILIPAVLMKLEQILAINFSINYDWFYLRQLIILLVLFITCSLLYHFIPNIDLRPIDTMPGALICIILWSIILNLFSIYLKNFNQFNLLYGSLGGIIGSLMFFYLISLVFIIGAQFNYHFKRAYKRK